MNVELPKYGAIKREAVSSMPMLERPPRKTIGRRKGVGGAEREEEFGRGTEAGKADWRMAGEGPVVSIMEAL